MWHCRACKPDMPLTATTLTLSARTAKDWCKLETCWNPTRLRRMIEAACKGLSITPEQLRAELEAGGDIHDLAPGELSERGLRMVAETLTVMRYPYPPEVC